MSPFLDSIATIVGVFQQHARGDGDSSGLSRRRMRELIQREFADSLVKPHDPQTIEKILQFLEWDGDGNIDFNEFLLLVFRVAKCCFWFQPRAPFLVQRTKLPTSGKSFREPEFRSRGSRRQLQEEEEEEEEEERQTWERNREVGLQGDLRVREVEILEETRRDQQERHRRSGRDTEPRGELIPREFQERSQELCEQQERWRRRQPPEPERREGERRDREGLQEEETADVRTGRQRREPQPRPDRWSCQEPGRDERTQRPRGADGEGDNRPREPESLREERSRHRRRELEQRELEGRSCRAAELECPESRRPHQSYLEEPLEIELGERGRAEPEERGHRRRTRRERESAGRGRELELEVSESRTREREEEVAARNLRETRERREREIRDLDDDGRRQRESVRYEREREISVAAAEADVRVQREIRERGEELRRRERPRECEERRICPRRDREEPLRKGRIDRERDLEVSEHRTREREEEVAAINLRETRERREREIRELDDDGRRRQEVYDRRREISVAAAEADVRVRREIQERGEELRRKERPREGEEEAEPGRRISRVREREEALRERRIDRERELELELELEASERRSRQPRARAAQVTITDQREAREEIRLEVLEEEEEEELEQGRCRYQTLDVDLGDPCPPGQEVPVSDLRVRYLPAEPELRPDVRPLPEPVEPQTVAYLVHVIQNLEDPKATTYEIVCHQPGQRGRPVRVRTCSVSPRPPTDRRGHPEVLPPECQDNPEAPDEPREKSGNEVKDGALRDSAEPEAGKGERVKSKETRRRPEILEVEQGQPQGEGPQRVPREPGAGCQRRERQDSEAKSCVPPERRDAERRDPGETRREGGQEGEEAPEEEPSKRSPRESGSSQVPREGGTKQGQEAPSRPRDESKTS
uniref:trichohyalin-like n=1 Tax=Lonchura striata TaxID=40157 RepID=UPI0012930CFF|nr:trichohyalin-like [Lonchura striata domestica]